ncbi:bombyxin A-2 homolog [Colias croceus]|uniref:bombyxin A-2 homolog n=1 Tax=Colias crocea TaxID=72248 RepID=UPI001E27B89A|nr:bombyxin A-2 homolog [Colias croceus]
MKTTFVLSFLSVFLIIKMSNGEGQTYCGRRLASTLAYVCENSISKRSEYDDFEWPWIARQQASSMRNKRQVVSECCDKPCTLDELLAYC